jgi:hypothetical protein
MCRYKYNLSHYSWVFFQIIFPCTCSKLFDSYFYSSKLQPRYTAILLKVALNNIKHKPVNYMPYMEWIAFFGKSFKCRNAALFDTMYRYIQFFFVYENLQNFSNQKLNKRIFLLTVKVTLHLQGIGGKPL